MEEEYQNLMIESSGIQTEKIKALGERIDNEKDFIKSKEFERFALK